MCANAEKTDFCNVLFPEPTLLSDMLLDSRLVCLTGCLLTIGFPAFDMSLNTV